MKRLGSNFKIVSFADQIEAIIRQVQGNAENKPKGENDQQATWKSVKY